MLFQSMQRGSTDIAEVASDYDFSVAAHFDTAGYPILHFVERNYAGDPSNWWIPNAACTQAMLRSSGFRIAAHPEDEVYLRSEEHTSELQQLMRISYAVFCLKKKTKE